jgi:hypothetical protein
MTPKSPKPDDPAQSKRFRELAKEIGADGTQNALGQAVKRLAAQKRERPPAKPVKKGK